MLEKREVKAHWEDDPAGSRYGRNADADDVNRLTEQRRYELEPFIPDFARFDQYSGKRVLEIGIGLGVDFSRWLDNGAIVTGVDLTSNGVSSTAGRTKALGLYSRPHLLLLGDAENLPFRDSVFDLVYSWGVLHHSPDTPKTLEEAYRVLKPGGLLKVMVYSVSSWTAGMVWLRFGALRGRPWRSPASCAFHHLESPGTKLYTKRKFDSLLRAAGFTGVDISTKLGPGDLLNISRSARYASSVYQLAWALYPRKLIQLLGDRFGLYMMATASRPA